MVEEVKDGEITVPKIIVAPESDSMTLTVPATNLTEEKTAPGEEEEGSRMDPNMTELLTVGEWVFKKPNIWFLWGGFCLKTIA